MSLEIQSQDQAEYPMVQSTRPMEEYSKDEPLELQRVDAGRTDAAVHTRTDDVESAKQEIPIEYTEIHDQTSRLPFARMMSAYSCLVTI